METSGKKIKQPSFEGENSGPPVQGKVLENLIKILQMKGLHESLIDILEDYDYIQQFKIHSPLSHVPNVELQMRAK